MNGGRKTMPNDRRQKKNINDIPSSFGQTGRGQDSFDFPSVTGADQAPAQTDGAKKADIPSAADASDNTPVSDETESEIVLSLNETIEIPLSDELLSIPDASPHTDTDADGVRSVTLVRRSRRAPKKEGNDPVPAGKVPSPGELPVCGPLLRQANSVRSRNADLCMTLLPLLAFSVYLYGARAVTLTVLSLCGACLFELWGCLLSRRSVRAFRTDAVLDGLVWACLLPASCPFSIAVAGASVISVLRQICRRFSFDDISPVVAVRLLAGIAFSDVMTAYPAVGEPLAWFDTAVKASEQLPLSALYAGYLPSVSAGDALFGYFSGAMGTVAFFLIVPAAVYLCVRRVCAWQPVVLYGGAYFALNLIFSRSSDMVMYALLELICGGVLFGAVWLAGSSRSLPVTGTGRMIFGVGCAVLHFVCRQLFPALDAMSLAILVMGCLSRPLDSWLHPVRQKQKRLNHSQNRAVQQHLARMQSEADDREQ